MYACHVIVNWVDIFLYYMACYMHGHVLYEFIKHKKKKKILNWVPLDI